MTAPDASGGTNWQPSSYNPKTNMIYVCSQDGVAGYSASDIPGFTEGKQFIGSVIAITGFGPNPGHLTAIDALDRRDQVAQRVPGVLLLRLRHHGRQPDFVGPQQRRARGLQRDDRRPAVDVPDRRRRQQRRRPSSSTTGTSTSPSTPAATASPARRTATACGCSRLDGTMGPVAAGRTRPRPPRTPARSRPRRPPARDHARGRRRRRRRRAGVRRQLLGLPRRQRHGRQRRPRPDGDPGARAIRPRSSTR